MACCSCVARTAPGSTRSREPRPPSRRRARPTEFDPSLLVSRAIPEAPQLAPVGRWVRGGVVSAYGLRVGVRTDSEASFDALSDALPPGSIPSRGRGGVVDRLYSL